MNRLSLVLLSTIVMILNGCSGSDGKPLTKPKESKPAKHKKIKPAKPEVINGYTLPPEPDPKINNATLLGVDSNQNGIRDDVERWIVKTFEHGGFRNNLYLTDRFFKTAKNYQKRLANEDPTPEEVLKLYKENDDNGHCLWGLTGQENKNYATERRKLKDKVFNTHKRLELFFLYEKRLPMREYYKYRLDGGTINEMDAREKACMEEYLNFKGGK